MSKIKVTRIPKLNTLVIKQTDGRDFFISAEDSIVISISSLSFILKFLVINGLMSVKVLEGIASEYYSLRNE